MDYLRNGNLHPHFLLNGVLRAMMVLSCLLLLFPAVAGGAAAASGGAAEGSIARLKVVHSSSLRILQLTDLHFFSRDKSTWDEFNARAVEQMRKLVAVADPNLVVITGDVWSENQEGLGEAHMRYAVRQFEQLGVPWAFTWGNHDQLADFSVAHKVLAEARNSLYRGGESDGNYVIEICNSSDRCVWRILCLNSHRDGLGKEQQQWLLSLPSSEVRQFAFFHIPLRQYADVWSSGAATGIWGEDVCMEKEDGSTLPILKALGVSACFCGHDHQNDYSGVADGVELVYGRVSRAGGYGADTFSKGGKLITLDCNKRRYSWESITPDGTHWSPKPGERTVMAN